jgi:Tat protein translocase TatB subunit
MFGIGMQEMVVILVIALIVLGPKRLPELARTLGRTLAEFRRTATDLRREFSDVADEASIAPPAKAAAPLPERGPAAGASPEPGAPAGEAVPAGAGKPGEGGPAVG